jgi:hypothetical protein
MKNQKLALEMEFPVTNDCIAMIKRKLCFWGQQKTSYDREGKNITGIIINHKININIGSTSPLWLNPSKTFYKILFVLCLVVALIFIGSFVAIQYYNNSLLNDSVSSTQSDQQNNKICVQKSYTYIKSYFIIIGSIILLLNCKIYNLYSLIKAFFALFVAMIDFASDVEWSRYLFLNTLLWLGLCGFLIADFIYVK